MANVSKQAILSKTHYGTNIYSHILREFYPDEIVMRIVGRDCGLCHNPFNKDKETLHVWIKKTDPANPLSMEIAMHEDTENAIPSGNVFNFAELHYKQQGDELLQTLNKEMHLHIGETFNFYRDTQKKLVCSGTSQIQSLPLGEVGGAFFSFFRAPISNTKPHKAVSLLDAYNYIIGDYAKEKTEKLRSLLQLSPPLGGKGVARLFKAANFDYCTFSGTFNSRSDKELIKHSELLCVDFDHLLNVEELRSQLLQDEYFDTQLLFRSPSGDGIKWIIPIDTTQAPHGDYFAAVANYIQQTYGVEIDKSGKDISRACFLPHDPQVFIHSKFLKQ